ncbi:hypothetical protein [Psychromonas sp. SP041]|uniref:hypothetical protein n=1 Tax=Psychromonas sp. SP041 TaxID=1365007 RepID=UPI0010C7C04F|nr:hypothetical protein [Psychromonas sp. SP041]
MKNKYKVMAFVTDGKGNIFIDQETALLSEQVTFDRPLNINNSSDTLSVQNAVSIRNAFMGYVTAVSVLPCYVEESETLKDVRFCIIVTDEEHVNKTKLPIKIPFSVVLDQYTSFMKEAGDPNNNLVMTNYFFEVSSKINAVLSATSASDYVKKLSAKNSPNKKLICPICKSVALRESTVKPKGGFIQEIACSDKESCSFTMSRHVEEATSWDAIIENWLSLKPLNK